MVVGRRWRWAGWRRQRRGGSSCVRVCRMGTDWRVRGRRGPKPALGLHVAHTPGDLLASIYSKFRLLRFDCQFGLSRYGAEDEYVLRLPGAFPKEMSDARQTLPG
jgi:hypothetical protein